MALLSCSRLENPCDTGILFEVFSELIKLFWKYVSHWNDIHIEKGSIFIFFCDRILFLFHLLPESLDILNHAVLPYKFIRIWKMVDKLHVLQPVLTIMIKHPPNRVRQCPIYIPIIFILCPLPASFLKVFN